MKNDSGVEDTEWGSIAWCGWRIEVPREWIVLKVEGGWKRGSAMVGPDGSPVMMLKWWRVSDSRFDAQDWLQQRFRKLGAVPDGNPPCPAGFNAVGWLKDFHCREDITRSVWYGFCAAAEMMIECVTTSLVKPEYRALVFERVIPAMRATAADEPVEWSLFSARFISPEGFKLYQRHLFLGDIGLELRDETGCRLLLRQVYPAGLALERRSLKGWLNTPLFKERRFIRKSQIREVENGLLQCGWKRLPVPLGWLRPLYSCAGAFVDKVRDRLLLADLQSSAEHDGSVVLAAVDAMKTGGAV